MEINLRISINAKGINNIEKEIEELNIRTEIGRVVEKMGYKDFEFVSIDDGHGVVLDEE